MTLSLAAPRWRSIEQLSQANKPPGLLRGWLTDTGSLTARLVALSGRQFRVEVLCHSQGRATLDEARALGIPPCTRVIIREVILYGCDKPWVFARSILPLPSLVGRLRQLKHQGSKPLGAFLFQQRSLVRSPMTVCALSGREGYIPARCIPATLAPHPRLWGRRSMFSVDAKPLLVSEVFLPHFLDDLSDGQGTRVEHE